MGSASHNALSVNYFLYDLAVTLGLSPTNLFHGSKSGTNLISEAATQLHAALSCEVNNQDSWTVTSLSK